MKLLSFLIFSFLLFNLSACKSQNATQGNANLTNGKTLLKMDSLKSTAKKIYLHKDKKLEVSEQNGSLIYKIVDSKNTNVLQFSYEKDMDKVAFDGGYREELVFEVPGNVMQQSYEDLQLQQTKMLFGRYCFCRGQTGLYKVKKGKLKLSSSKDGVHFELFFRIDEVPQVTEKIEY